MALNFGKMLVTTERVAPERANSLYWIYFLYGGIR